MTIYEKSHPIGFLFLSNLTPDSHEDFPKTIFSFAIADAPHLISPCVTFNKLCVAGVQELLEEVGVLCKLSPADRVHNIVLDRLPLGTQRNSASQPFGSAGIQLTELSHPFWALGCLKRRLVVGKLIAMICDGCLVKVAQETVGTIELRTVAAGHTQRTRHTWTC